MTKLTVLLDTNTNLTNKLSSIRETQEHEYIQALPIDTYLRKMSDVKQSLQELVNYSKNPLPYNTSVSHPLKSYVQSLSAFYDNIFRILKYTQNMEGKKDMASAINWIKNNGSPSNKSFFDKTKSQQELISKIDNKIKHDDVRIVDFHIKKTYLNIPSKQTYIELVEGFYINAVIDKEDLWGPDPTIHSYIDGKIATAISYNFFILNTCYSLIHWLKILGSILKKGNKNLPKVVDTSLATILEIASSIEENFFPDEYKKAYLSVCKTDEGYKIEYPYQFKGNGKEKLLIEGVISGRMDANARTNTVNQKMPYFNMPSDYWKY